MRALLIPVLSGLFALGCTPTIDDGGKSSENDGLDVGGGADAGGGTDGTDGTDGADGDEVPELVPDFSGWSGSRTFIVDADDDSYDCEEVVDEDGSELISGATYEALVDLCPSCDHIYQIDVDADDACGISIASPTWRGITLAASSAEVVRFVEDRGGLALEELDTNADWDGWTLDFAYGYEDWWGNLDIEGTVTFPALQE